MRRLVFPHCTAFMIVLTLCSKTSAQGADHFLDWSYQDASHLLEHHFPTMLLVGAGGAAFVAAGSYVDEPILNGVQSVLDRDNLVVKITNELGGRYAVAAPIAIFAAATATGDSKLQDAAFTSVQAIVYASAVTSILKEAAGRHRPEEGAGARRFEPFSGHHSAPSGHATIAFALLTPWIYYYDHPATYSLMILGVGTSLSRIALDQHWPTDVITGGAIGFLMARFLSKRHLDEDAGDREPVMMMPLVAGTLGGMRVTASFVVPAR
ncbi:MAG TPA: phosphatase PAP2 family protein [Rhodothermales bacterium]